MESKSGQQTVEGNLEFSTSYGVKGECTHTKGFLSIDIGIIPLAILRACQPVPVEYLLSQKDYFVGLLEWA
jgi:hypothetical protein